MPRRVRLHILTKSSIDRLGDGRHHDGGGLYLNVRGAARAWEFRYRRPGGSYTWAGFGPYVPGNLEDVRARAADWRALVRSARDPQLEQAVRPNDQSKATTRPGFAFKEIFQGFMKDNATRWTNKKNIDQWHSTISEFVLPLIGEMDVRDIKTSDIQKILLQPLKRPNRPEDGKLFWFAINVTAARLQKRVENIFDYAIALSPDHAKFNNPADWKIIKHVVGARENSRNHHKALDHENAPAFWARLLSENALSAEALRFTMLTAARTNEVLGMTFSEINWDDCTWTIPLSRNKIRRKTRNPHVVVLSRQALLLLRQRRAATTGNYVWGSVESDEPPSNAIMDALLERLGVNETMTVHGMRSTFRDYVGEETEYEPDLGEFALGHIISQRARAAYQRKSGVNRRRAMMQGWANYLSGRPRSGISTGFKNET